MGREWGGRAAREGHVLGYVCAEAFLGRERIASDRNFTSSCRYRRAEHQTLHLEERIQQTVTTRAFSSTGNSVRRVGFLLTG